MLLAESDIQGCGRPKRLAETAVAIEIKKASRVQFTVLLALLMLSVDFHVVEWIHFDNFWLIIMSIPGSVTPVSGVLETAIPANRKP